VQWLRKATLRASGLKARHDEDAIYAAELAAARAAPAGRRGMGRPDATASFDLATRRSPASERNGDHQHGGQRRDRGERPRMVTADRGYGEAAVENALHELGVCSVVIPRKGRPAEPAKPKNTGPRSVRDPGRLMRTARPGHPRRRPTSPGPE
jgi:hypothetical protein